MNARADFKFKRLPDTTHSDSTLLVVCGALCKEVVHLVEHNQLHSIDIQALPAHYHHRPALIPPALDTLLEKNINTIKTFM